MEDSATTATTPNQSQQQQQPSDTSNDVIPFTQDGDDSLRHEDSHLSRAESAILINSRRRSMRHSVALSENKRASMKQDLLPGDQITTTIRMLREIQEWPSWRKAVKRFVSNPYFERFVLFLISANCIIMATEDTTANERNDFLTYTEYIFLGFFVTEMLLKWIALGFWQNSFSYFRDGWNTMDCVIVVASLASFFAATFGPSSNMGLGAIRSIRLLRPLRAVSGVPEIRIIVNSLIQSIPELSSVMLLYFFVLLVFGIMFVQTFKGKLVNRCYSNGVVIDEDRVCKLDDDLDGYFCAWNTTCTYYGNPGRGMVSYDHIIWAFLSLFQACTLEGWSDMMYAGMDVGGRWTCVLFVLLVVIGAFFIINLTVVIITYSFWVNVDNEREKNLKITSEKYLECAVEELQSPSKGKKEKTATIVEGDPAPAGVTIPVPTTSNDNQNASNEDEELETAPALPSWRMAVRKVYFSRPMEAFITLMIFGNTALLSIEYYGQPDIMDQILENGNLAFTCVFTIEWIIKVIAVTRKEFFASKFNVFDTIVIILSWVDIFVLKDVGTGVSALRAFRLLRILKLAKQFPSLQKWLHVMINSVASASYLTALLCLFIFVFALVGMQFFGGTCKSTATKTCLRSNFDNIGSAIITVFQIITGEDWNNVMYETMNDVSPWGAIYYIVLIIVGNYMLLNLFIAMLLTHDQEEEVVDSSTENGGGAVLVPVGDPNENSEQSTGGFIQACKANNAFFIFSPTNPLRKGILFVVQNKYFEAIIIFAIIVTSVELAVDSKFRPPDDAVSRYIDLIDEVLTFLFFGEALLKICGMGLILHKEAYLRDLWNVLDFGIVLTAVVSMLMNLGGLRVVKMLRTLRPLRFINKSNGLRVVVDALMSSIPPLMSCLTIIMMFWLMYAIMGVQFFAGKFQTCLDDSLINTTRVECLAKGGAWGNRGFNFDHVGQSMLSLFVIAGLEGWVALMRHGVDAVADDMPPQENYQPWMAIYFILFIILGAFFSLNFIVAVLMDNYQQQKHKSLAKIQKDAAMFLTREQETWLEIQRTIVQHVPVIRQRERMSPFRERMHTMVTGRAFDTFIVLCICLNVLFMATEHKDQPDTWTFALDISDYAFAGVFAIEAILKLIGLGFFGYFHDRSNCFDMFVIVVTTSSMILEEIFSTSTFVSVLRVLRLIRLLRVIRTSKGVRIILNTLVSALPTMANVAGILFLFLYFYAVVGVQLFSTTPRGGQALNHRANFEDFLNSFLMLLRISTGEGWQMVMQDTQNEGVSCSPKLDECNSSWLSLFYFLSFAILGKSVFLNLFIAVISESFETVANEEEMALSSYDVQCFIQEWTRIDVLETCYMPTTSMELFFTRLEPPFGFSAGMRKSDRHGQLIAISSTLREVCGRNGTPFPQGMVFLRDVISEASRCIFANSVFLPDNSQKPIEESWDSILPQHKNDEREYRSLLCTLCAIRIQTVWRGKRDRTRVNNIRAQKDIPPTSRVLGLGGGGAKLQQQRKENNSDPPPEIVIVVSPPTAETTQTTKTHNADDSSHDTGGRPDGESAIRKESCDQQKIEVIHLTENTLQVPPPGSPVQKNTAK